MSRVTSDIFIKKEKLFEEKSELNTDTCHKEDKKMSKYNDSS